MRTYDAVVLGAGSMGLATGYALARAGRRVLLLDRYTPPHAFGSHSGETRLLRVAYIEGAAYVLMARRARALWLDLEARERPPAPLFDPSGVLSILAPDAPAVARMEECITAYDLRCERLDATEAMRRWPAWRLPSDEVVYRDDEAGVLWADRCLEALREGALRLGAEARFSGECEEITLTGDGVTVRWGGEEFGAARLVLTAGAGNGPLLARFFPEFPEARVPLQPVRKVVAWYRPEPGADLGIGAFPPFCYDDGAEGFYYGFSDYGSGCKIGRHDGGVPCTLEGIEREIASDDAELVSTQAFLRRRVHGLVPEPTRPFTCLYTLTPDEDFVIDALPSAPQVLLAAGFSGHGFKFATAIGEHLARLAMGEAPMLDLAPFRIARFVDA